MTRSPRSYRQLGALAIAAGLLASCASPFDERADEFSERLRRSIQQSAERETLEAESRPGTLLPERRTGDLDIPEQRMEELRRMAGPDSYTAEDFPDLGPDLLGEPPEAFRLSLEQAVGSAVRHNLDAQLATIRPAIAGSTLVAAEAAFDWVFFADYQWERLDEPSTEPLVNGVPVGVGARVSDTNRYSVGVRRRLASNGLFTITQGQSNNENRTPGFAQDPDPANAVFLELGIDQPLLRGFGSDVALADVRLARNAERDAIYALKQSLINTVTATERAYWDLLFAYRVLLVNQRLLERGIETRDVLASRRNFDVRDAEYSDAVARVEARRGDVIRAGNNLRQASDRLKALMNDPSLTVGSELLVLPTDRTVDEPLAFSLLDTTLAALRNRPEIQRAIISIADSSIRSAVARNARLPILDLAMRTRFQGLDRDTGDAYDTLTDADFVNFIVSVQFEQPIGNRESEALFRRAQLDRLAATVSYRSAVQRVVLDLKTALRDLTTNYALIEQTRVSRLAAAENLRTLLVRERTVQALDPAFLDLKFRRQEALARAEIEEARSRVDYATALADLYAAMGTALERNGIRFEVPDVPPGFQGAE